MTPTDDDHVDAAAGIEPLTVTMNEAVRRTGISRTGLYRLATSGSVVFLKHGGRTLVDYASLRAAIARLPRAVIRIAA
jgi:hypothetical protein